MLVEVSEKYSLCVFGGWGGQHISEIGSVCLFLLSVSGKTRIKQALNWPTGNKTILKCMPNNTVAVSVEEQGEKKTNRERTSPDRLSDGGGRGGGDWYTKAPTHPPLLPRAMWTE